MKAHIFHVLETINGQTRPRQSDIHVRTLQSQNQQLERSLKEKDAEITALQSKVSNLESRLEELMDTDSITGLPNRESFRQHLLHSIKRALRLGYSLSVLILDIDQLEYFSQNYGEDVSNQITSKVAHILRTSVREVDMAARWNNKQLISVLHETDAEGASLVAQRIQRRISRLETTHLKSGEKINIQASIGIAVYSPSSGEAHDLIAEACEALSCAKVKTANRTAIA